MINKKSESQIITVILLILIVFTAIAIVWQIADKIIRGNIVEVNSQSICLKSELEIQRLAPSVYSIKRLGGGRIIPEPSIAIFIDGKKSNCNLMSPLDPNWSNELTSVRCILEQPVNLFEAALVLDDGTTCDSIGGDKIINAETLNLGTFCGDKKVEGNEQCDDGNTVNGDGCSSICKNEIS